MKKPTTSSSHPSDPSDEFMPCELPLPKIKTCPECGAKSIERIRSDYLTEKGFLIPDLERFHCNTCESDFFDIDSMTRVIEEGTLADRKARRTTRKRTVESKDA